MRPRPIAALATLRRRPSSGSARPADRTKSVGQSMVEFALILPVMLLLVAAAVDLGRLFFGYIAVENAAKEGALYGARYPLCADNTNVNCDQPGQNVQWYVENEAASSLKNALGNTLLTTGVTCRAKATGVIRQPINDCVNGDTYEVKVAYDFKLITPILSNILGQTITLTSQSEATVLGDAYDPSGLEVLVWVDGTNADNLGAIAAACSVADSVAAPSYYYAPCQDQSNVDNYLQVNELTTVTYKVRVRNTGNITLNTISYQFAVNGSNITTPAGCSGLPTSLAKGAAVQYCTFTQTATSTSVGAINDFTVGVTATTTASGLPNGSTNGAGVIRVAPRPKLAINVWASQYRLGGTGNGLSGVASYATGNQTFVLDAASSDPTIRNPVGWLYVSVQNQGATASNFAVDLKRNGAAISLSSCGTIPTSLASSGTSGDTFTCILPVTFSATGAFTFLGSASATNSSTLSGTQPSVVLTLNTCTGGQKVIPNLVDTLNPSPDGTSLTVSQSKNLWQTAGFNTSNYTTNPAGASGSAKVTTQSRTAYTCFPANTTVTVTAP